MEATGACRGRHVVKMFEVVHGRNTCYMVLELMEDGATAVSARNTGGGGGGGVLTPPPLADLLHYLFKPAGDRPEYTERSASLHILHTARALKACHDVNYAHLDVKPDNVLLGCGGRVAKLCDFGMAARAPAARRFGTLLFVAPEVLRDGRAGTPADCWSLGCATHGFELV